MSIFGAFHVVVVLFVTILLGRLAFKYVGWWAFIPAGLLGVRLVAMSAVTMWGTPVLVTAQARKLLGRVTGGKPQE